MNETEGVRRYVEAQIETTKSELDHYMEQRLKADLQLKKLADTLEMLEGMLAFLNQAEGKKPAELAPAEQQIEQVQPYGEMSIGDGAFEILTNAGRPLHVTKIWDALQRGGKTSKAKKPVLSVTGALLRDERFENLGRNTFRVKELPNDANEES